MFEELGVPGMQTIVPPSLLQAINGPSATCHVEQLIRNL
jgi:hypothetical protein